MTPEVSRKRKYLQDLQGSDGGKISHHKSPKISFIEHLRDTFKDTNPLKVLKHFLQGDLQQKFESIEVYIKDGGTLSELLVLLNNTDIKKDVNLALPVYQVLRLFIIKCLSDFPNLQEQLVQECRQLLSIHLECLISMLSHTHSLKHKKISLALLTVLVSCHESLAWEIVGKFNLYTQDLNSLVAATKVDPQSIRNDFIHFLMSFLIDQPSSLITKFIKTKGLVTSIFPGLVNDSFHNVILVLDALKTIVDSKEINKSSKMIVFNTSAVTSLIQVYLWDPTFGATDVGPANESEKLIVKEHLHELLVPLLTSVKMGVIFQDPSLGTGIKVNNELVSKVISGSGQPWVDPFKEDLYVKMFLACPDVIKLAYKQIQQYFSSVSPHKWYQIINFFVKFLHEIHLEIDSLNHNGKLKFIKLILAPDFLLKELKKVLTTDNRQLRKSSLSCLHACMSKINKYSTKEFSDLSTANYLMMYLAGSGEQLFDNISFWCDHEDVEAVSFTFDCIIDLFKLCPQLFDCIRFQTDSQQVVQMGINKIKEIILNTPGDDKRWNLAGVKCIQLKLMLWASDRSDENFGQWIQDLSCFINSDNVILSISLEIMEDTLSSTGYLGTKYELKLWIYALSKYCNKDTCLLIIKSIRYASKNLKSLYKDLLVTEEVLKEKDDKTGAYLNLDDLITASQCYEEICNLKYNTDCSVSLLFLSMLKVINKDLNSFSNCIEFVQFLIIQNFHHQLSLDVFSTIVKQYCRRNDLREVVEYIESWINGDGTSLNMKPFSATMFCVVSNWLLGVGSDPPLGLKLEQQDALMISRQCVFYLVHGKVPPENVALIIQDIMTTQCCLAPFILSYPQVLSRFSPLSNSFNIHFTNLVIFSILETKHPQLQLQPLQYKLSFELRYAVLKKSSLKKCQNIDNTLDLIGLPENDVQFILEHCSYLPSKCFNYPFNWYKVVAYLLKKAVEIKYELEPHLFISLLNKCFVGDIEGEGQICESITFYMSKFYHNKKWNKDQIKSLHEILSKLCMCDIWYEELATELFKHIPNFEFVKLPIERSISLMSVSEEDCITHHVLKVILEMNYKSVFKGLCSSSVPDWLPQLSVCIQRNSLTEISCDKLVLKICKNNMKIKVDIKSLTFICILFEKVRMRSLLFHLVHDWLMDKNNWEDENLRKLLTASLDLLLKDGGGKVSSDLCKTLILLGLKEPSSDALSLLVSALKLDLIEMMECDILNLTTNHSLFLDTLLEGSPEVKNLLLSLLYELLKKDKTLMKGTHIPVYLSAYHASLSIADQILLQILKYYEEEGISMKEWCPYVWGQLAVQRYSIKEVSKRVDISLSPTVDLLDLNIVNNTISNFPVNRKLLDSMVSDYPYGSDIYDPVFILSVLSQSVGPGSDIYPRKVVCSGALSLALASLNSLDDGIRAAGYHLIHRFYQLLSDRKQDAVWLNFVETLQRSVSGTNNVKLSGPMSVFLARACLVMSDPMNPLYTSVNNFIFVRDSFRLDKIPAFLELFHSREKEKKLYQKWILEVLRDGIRESKDLLYALHSSTIKLILVYYNCNLATETSKALIEEIVQRILMVPDKKHRFLSKEYSIIPWLTFNQKFQLATNSTGSNFQLIGFLEKSYSF